MSRKFHQLTSSYARHGFAISTMPDTDPPCWLVRDTLTGREEIIGGRRNIGGDEMKQVRQHLTDLNPFSLREQRVLSLFRQGHSIGSTADLLDVHWVTVAAIRGRLGLPTKEARGARAAWRKGVPLLRGPRFRPGSATPARLAAEKLLGQGLAVKVIAGRVGLSPQRVSQIKNAVWIRDMWARANAETP